jgi:hypothetical protein
MILTPMPRVFGWGLFIIAFTAPEASAQRLDDPKGPRILVLSQDTSSLIQADSVVSYIASSVRRSMLPDQLHALSWVDAQQVATWDLPRSNALVPADLLELGKQLRATILTIRVESRRDGELRVAATIFRQQPQTVSSWPISVGKDAPAVAQILADRIIADSTIRHFGVVGAECPRGVLFEFQVDRWAVFIDDSTTAVRPIRRGENGETLIQFVVDTLGRPELATLKGLKVPSASVLPVIREAMSRWRFVPAQIGNCHVRQFIQVLINR